MMIQRQNGQPGDTLFRVAVRQWLGTAMWLTAPIDVENRRLVNLRRNQLGSLDIVEVASS